MASSIKLGSLVRVIRLPKYWAATDIRGSIGIIIGSSCLEYSGGRRRDIEGWCMIFVDDKRWTVPFECLENLSETR